MRPSGEVFGYYVITRQYFDRYRLPVMHTETNRKNEGQSTPWLWKEWSNVLRLRRDGVPILGFTWYSLLDQVDWDTALREDNHRINPLGLFDLNRKIRRVGEAYKLLISQWRDELPLQSMSRDMYLSQHDINPQQRAAVTSHEEANVNRMKRQPRIQEGKPSARKAPQHRRYDGDRRHGRSNGAAKSKAKQHAPGASGA
jgi:hypothetical protein